MICCWVYISDSPTNRSTWWGVGGGGGVAKIDNSMENQNFKYLSLVVETDQLFGFFDRNHQNFNGERRAK